MNKDIRTFLIKLIGTFAVLILIIVVGKKLKSSDVLIESLSWNSIYTESFYVAQTVTQARISSL